MSIKGRDKATRKKKDVQTDIVELDRIDPRHAKTIRDEGVLINGSQNG